MVGSAPLNEFVVKVASRCNLNCDYCYEYNLGDNSWKVQPKVIAPPTLERLGKVVAEHAIKHDLREVFISLHGGEPLLLGASGLSDVCRILRHTTEDACELVISLQTNGTLLSKRVIDVITEHRISVSISIDGGRAAHEKHRVDRRGRGSFDRVLRGITLMQDHAPKNLTGLLSVIDVQSDPSEIFDFVAAFGVSELDFLLPHYHWENPPPRPNNDRIAYGRWYWRLYRDWVSDKHPGTSIRFLANIVSQFAGGSSLYEAMTLAPVTLAVIGTDGAIEAVDSIKATGTGLQKLGTNIWDADLDALLDFPLLKVRQSGEGQLCAECRGCRFKRECAGGYFPHRWNRETDFNSPSVYCDDLYWLLTKIAGHLRSNAATS